MKFPGALTEEAGVPTMHETTSASFNERLTNVLKINGLILFGLLLVLVLTVLRIGVLEGQIDGLLEVVAAHESLHQH